MNDIRDLAVQDIQQLVFFNGESHSHIVVCRLARSEYIGELSKQNISHQNAHTFIYMTYSFYCDQPKGRVSEIHRTTWR